MLSYLPRRLRLPSLLTAALVLYLALLGRRDIVTGPEARVPQTARLMVRAWPWQSARGADDRSGAAVRVGRVVLTDAGGGVVRLYPAPGGETVTVNPWLVPVLQGRIRLQKPPLPYWCSAVLFRLFAAREAVEATGAGLEAYARLAPALLGALAMLLVCDLGRRLIGRAGGWAAGLIWVCSYLAYDEYRLAMPDPYLAFFTLLCVWAWIGAIPTSDSRSRKAAVGAPAQLPSASRFPQFLTLLLFYTSLALGVLAKGPLIFLHVGIALAAFHVCYRRLPPGRPWQHLLGAALYLAIAAPWFVYVVRNVPDAIALWRYESLGELSGNRENADPRWWYYLPAALWAALPWTPLWAAGLALPLLRKRTRLGRPDLRPLFSVLWYAATLLFFSFVHQKKPTYLLPVLPAQVLLTARAAVALLAHARLTWARGGKWRAPCPPGRRDTAGYLLGAQAAIGVGVAVALPVLVGRGNPDAPLTAMVPATLLGLAAGLAPVWALLRRPRQWLAVQAAGYAVLLALLSAGFVTPRDNHRSAKPMCDKAVAMLARRDTVLLSRWPMLADEAAFYLPLDVADGTGGSIGHRLLMIFDDEKWAEPRRRAGKAAALARGPVPAGDGAVPERYLTEWNDWIGGGRVAEARRVPVPAAPGDARWKLFELSVDRKVFTQTGRSKPLEQPENEYTQGRDSAQGRSDRELSWQPNHPDPSPDRHDNRGHHHDRRDAEAEDHLIAGMAR